MLTIYWAQFFEYYEKKVMKRSNCHQASEGYLAKINLFKVHDKNTRKRCEIKFKVNNNGTRVSRSSAFIVNFEHIPHLFLVFLLKTLRR